MVLREGDRLIVPQYNGTVKVNGAVMYANTVAFEKGKRASYYIDQAGGYAGDAVKSRAYIIYMKLVVYCCDDCHYIEYDKIRHTSIFTIQNVVGGYGFRAVVSYIYKCNGYET